MNDTDGDAHVKKHGGKPHKHVSYGRNAKIRFIQEAGKDGQLEKVNQISDHSTGRGPP